MSEYFTASEEVKPEASPLDQLEELLVELEEVGEVDLDQYAEVCAEVAEVYGLSPDDVQRKIATIRSEIV